jgi:hypothetical protein
MAGGGRPGLTCQTIVATSCGSDRILLEIPPDHIQVNRYEKY